MAAAALSALIVPNGNWALAVRAATVATAGSVKDAAESDSVGRTRSAVSPSPAVSPRSTVTTRSAVGATLADRTKPTAAGRHLKPVRYLGYTFLVPRTWPVIDNHARGRGCVRFDQHAIYLGDVSDDEFCPSWLLGTTESMLIQPGPARATRMSREDPVARQVIVHAPRIVITATFDTDPSAIYRILASASLPAPVVTSASQAKLARTPVGGNSGPADLDGRATPALHARRSSSLMRSPMPLPALPATVASYRGLGFDACTAPSKSYMNAWWRDSPYRSIGIYIGGADRACAQPNLDRSWVRAQAQAGWRFIPLYAGPQAAFGELHVPVSQGRAAAHDAVAQARQLGFGPHTPIYYDMEAYPPRASTAALRFLSAWTRELHRLGYGSGVYSSSDSGVVDLARQYSRGVYAMPNVIYDALWNGSATTNDSNVGRRHWRRHHRIHQFSGNVTQTYGGDTINIDEDYLDVRVNAPDSTPQQTPALALPDGSVDLFYQGQGNQVWLDRYVQKAGWAKPERTGAESSSVPSAVWTGSEVDVFREDARGYLWVDSYRPDGTLTGRRQLSMMGILGSAPRAVAQSGGVIDVFWRGSADDHLWHGQYTPGIGWSGPQGLGGSLDSAPSPVVSSPGTTEVFWKGGEGSLWRVTRGLGGRWSAPMSLGMGPLGGPPNATAQPGGGIEVCWAGSGNGYLWEAFYQPRTGWRGPRDLGGQVRSQPWPVTADSTVQVLWRGPGHRLVDLSHRADGGWNHVGWQAPVLLRRGWLRSAPFAAVGAPGAALRVFWQGKGGALWTASLAGGGWTSPTRLAAHSA